MIGSTALLGNGSREPCGHTESSQRVTSGLNEGKLSRTGCCSTERITFGRELCIFSRERGIVNIGSVGDGRGRGNA